MWSLNDVIQALASPRLHPSKLPDEGGLYAVYASPEVWQQLRLGEPPDERPLYVGKSRTDLMKEGFFKHFQDGKTSSSTLRRSLAGLLSSGDRFNGRPRGLKPDQRFANFELRPHDETELTTWMLENLEVGIWWSKELGDLDEFEDGVKQHWGPPLNLDLPNNSWAKRVKQCRRQVAFQAKDWYFRHVANQVRELSCRGLTLGASEDTVSSVSGVLALHSQGERRAILLASDEVTVGGLRLRPRAPLGQVLRSVPGLISLAPYFYRGSFAGVSANYADLTLHFRMEDELRMAMAVLRDRGFQEGSFDRYELANFEWYLDLRLHRTRHYPTLVLDSRTASIQGVRLGQRQGEFEEVEGVDVLYGQDSKRVVAIAGSEICVSGHQMKLGSLLLPVRAAEGGGLHFLPYSEGDEIWGFMMACPQLGLHYNLYGRTLKLAMAMLVAPEESSSEPDERPEDRARKERFDRNMQARIRSREEGETEVEYGDCPCSEGRAIQLPYITLEAGNPLLPAPEFEQETLICLPGGEIDLNLSPPERQQVMENGGALFLCAPHARTGCLAIVEGEPNHCGYSTFRVLRRARLAVVEEKSLSGLPSCSVQELPEPSGQRSPIVQAAFSRLRATMRTQIRYEEYEPYRQRWEDLLVVANPDLVASYVMRYSEWSDQRRQEFLDKDSLATRLELARSAVLRERKVLRGIPEPDPHSPEKRIHVPHHCLWSKSLRSWEHPPSPGRSFATNPLAIENTLVVSCSLPSRVWSISRSDGRVRWSRRLSRFSKAPLVARGILIVPTTDTLYAFEPISGKKLWELCPYGTNNEWFYSYPYHFEGRLFFGDNNGHLNCAELRTGEWLWTIDCQARRSIGRPFAKDARAFFSTTKLRLSCHQAETGHYLWTQNLDDHLVGPLCSYRDGLLACSGKSASVYRPENGELLSRWASPSSEIGCFCVATDRLFLYLEAEDSGRIMCLVDGQEQWAIETGPFTQGLRWDEYSKLLYEVSYSGVTAISPHNGERLKEFVVRYPEPPALVDGQIYICTGWGKIFALDVDD